MNKLEKIQLITIVLVVILVGYLIISTLGKDYVRPTIYCQDFLGDKGATGSTSTTEPGWVKCCWQTSGYINHIKQDEKSCEVVEYDEEYFI